MHRKYDTTVNETIYYVFHSSKQDNVAEVYIFRKLHRGYSSSHIHSPDNTTKCMEQAEKIDFGKFWDNKYHMWYISHLDRIPLKFL